MSLSEFDYHESNRPLEPVQVWCPFCLHTSKRLSFERYLKGGKLSKEYRCPECQRDFFKSSVLKPDTDILNYAKWVVTYPAGLFFGRLKSTSDGFEVWSRRLKGLGMASEFWDEYRKLKPKKEVV